MKKNVLIIPGSQNQIPLIIKAQQRGYRVVCADRQENCPGAYKADEFYKIGLDDQDGLLKLAQSINPIGIFTDQTDNGVYVVAWLCEKIGLRGIGVNIAKLFTKKKLMREFGKKHQFPTPNFQLCLNLNQALTSAMEIGYPLIIKPNSNQSSKGVLRVDNPLELRRLFQKSFDYANGDGVIVEKYIDGVEFTVEGFMGEGGHRTLGISQKSHYLSQPMVASSLLYTPINKFFDYHKLEFVNDDWINKSGLPFGMTHAEYKFSNGQYYLIEIAARGGGNRIASDIVPWISGVDYQELMIDAVTEGNFKNLKDKLSERCGLLEFFKFPSGVLQILDGIEEAKKFKGVLDVVINYSVGDFLPDVSDDTSRLGYFILATDTDIELTLLRENVLKTIKVEVR